MNIVNRIKQFLTPDQSPADLDECFVRLRKMLCASDLELIQSWPEDKMCSLHFNVGMFLRNVWGLWRDSRLSRWFNERGIHHADDMSGIILTSFWCHLHGQDLRLDEQIAFYREYWRKAEAEKKETRP